MISVDPVLILAAAWMTVLINISGIFEWLRNIHTFFSCPMCVGTWGGFFAGLIVIYFGHAHEAWWVMLGCYALLTSLTATALFIAVDRLLK